MTDTFEIFTRLARAIHDAGDSGNFTAKESARLSHAQVALNAAIQNFERQPGMLSAQELAAGKANLAIDALGAAGTGHLDEAIAATQEATRVLIAATAGAENTVSNPRRSDAALRQRKEAIPALQGSLRIARSNSATEADSAGAAGGGDATAYNKLITLFPAEALTLYGTGLAIFAAGDGAKFGVVVVCLVVLLFVRWVANTSRPLADGLTNTDRPAVAVAVIAFLLWSTATDPDWLFAPAALFHAPSSEEVRTIVQQWAAFLGAAFILAASALYTPKPVPD